MKLQIRFSVLVHNCAQGQSFPSPRKVVESPECQCLAAAAAATTAINNIQNNINLALEVIW
jgi:hypothetical protein